jgi:hypothetical protein
MGLINEALDMKGGYVLTFSDNTSKTKHVRAFIEVEDEFTVCRVLRRMWQHRESLLYYQKAKNAASLRSRFFRLISTIESGGAIPGTDAIDRFARNETPDEWVASIEQDIGANKSITALALRQEQESNFTSRRYARAADRGHVDGQ